MNKIKVVVIGNCQARPIATLLEQMGVKVEVIKIAIVHLLSNEQKNEYEHFFKDADFIIAQVIADNYPCSFVTTKYLKVHYPGKVINIVNLYFSGYMPELRYIRLNGKGTLRGPLADYHNQTIYDCWKEKQTQQYTHARLEDSVFNKNKYGLLFEKSLSELSCREGATDIRIVNFIKNNLHIQKLFFTFNHPSLNLLIEYVKEILVFIDIKYTLQPVSCIKEPLGQFTAPINIHIKDLIDIEFKDITVFKGLARIDSPEGFIYKGFKDYTSEEFISESFINYDKNESFLDGVI